MTDEPQKNDEQTAEVKETKPEPTDLEKAQAESVEYKAGWQRAVADYKNLQKEVQARQTEWAQMSERQILEEFIPVYDNFKTAFAFHPELKDDHKHVKHWIDGIGHIMKQFKEILKAHGVEEIKTVGEHFDTRVHESAGEQEGDGKSGTIVREVSGGYKMGERVIKPARVIICK